MDLSSSSSSSSAGQRSNRLVKGSEEELGPHPGVPLDPCKRDTVQGCSLHFLILWGPGLVLRQPQPKRGDRQQAAITEPSNGVSSLGIRMAGRKQDGVPPPHREQQPTPTQRRSAQDSTRNGEEEETGQRGQMQKTRKGERRLPSPFTHATGISQRALAAQRGRRGGAGSVPGTKRGDGGQTQRRER